MTAVIVTLVIVTVVIVTALSKNNLKHGQPMQCFFFPKGWSLSVEGLLSTGPTPSSLVQKYFTKSDNQARHIFFLLLGNLRMSKEQFLFLLILRRKSAKNYSSQKLEYLSPQVCFIAALGGIWKIIDIHIWKKWL